MVSFELPSKIQRETLLSAFNESMEAVREETRVRRLLGPLQEFLALETSAGLVLLFCTAAALIWANSPWSESYTALWETRAAVSISHFRILGDLRFWVDDALMSVFFLVVGLEIKRELLEGELQSPKRAALPILAALGGVVVPAIIYGYMNAGGRGSAGWGIPMATDIAFAIGIMALLGKRVPLGVKVFLTALAIADDLAAVLVIAIFYTNQIAWWALALAGACFLFLLLVNWLQVEHPLPYLLLGLAMWTAMLQSGVHVTIAGVLLAIAMPSHSASGRTSLARRFEHALHPFVTFLIMPVFALANAGLKLTGGIRETLSQPIALGVLLGLMFGKPIGITLASWSAVKLKLATLPKGVNWREIHGASWLGGIGFTMSLFIAGLAFHEQGLLNTAKAGIFAGSLLAGCVGSLLLARQSARSSESGD
jgi:Na+:H+ antiporter, NhaA family